jgi:multidrug resistance efflux pump
MSLDQLKLRSDLIVRRQETSAGPVFVLKDPVNLRFFRLKEEEFSLAQQLDGATPLDVARRNVERRFEAVISEDTLERFIGKLRDLGLLDVRQPADRLHEPRRVRGSALYLRLKVFDPDRLLDRLVGRLGFFFTPHFLILSGGLILLALGIAVGHWHEIGTDLFRLSRLRGLVLAWFTVFLVTAAHEFAHGLTCKRFGGKVHELGFLLIYLQPALYCNVSDAWLFAEKSKRLWVTFAGAYLELCLWALATIFWRVTDPDNALNYAALVVMASSAAKMLVNLNPLIKLDGYYLLSDYLDIPNLREKAVGHVGARMRRLWGSTAQDARDITPRERRIYLTYGLLAGLYSFALLGFVILSLGRFLVARYQGLGFVLFATVLGSIGLKVSRKAPAVREAAGAAKPPRRKLIGTGALVAGVLALLFLGRLDLKVSGEFRILPAENSDVRAEVEGIIEQIPVAEGQAVARGDVVARLSERDFRAQLRNVTAEIDEKQARLRMLRAGPRQEEIEVARTAVQKAEERLKYGRGRLEMLRADPNLVSKKELDEAREEAAVRQREQEEARGRLRLLLAGSRPEEIEATEAEVARLQAQRAYLDEQLRLLTVVSPSSGVVTTPKLREKVGRHVSKGDLIATVHELETVKAEIAVSEKDISDVKVGQAVVLKARAYPETSVHGVVTSIAPIARQQDDNQPARTILVLTELANPSFLLKPEMTGNAKISTGKRRVVDLVTRRFARYIRVEFWSLW